MGNGRRSLGRRPGWWRRSRTRLARWLLALVLAAGAAALVAGQRRDDDATAAGLGPRRTVAVARHELSTGHTIVADDLVTRSLPVALLASGSLDGDVTGRTVTAPIVTGEVVNVARVAPAGASGLAALIPPGRRGVAVPRPADASGLAVRVGDVVDVVTGEDPGSGDGPTVAATGATVIDVSDGAVTLAVRADEAAAVAAAISRGIPVLAMVGPDSP